jgi:3-deoxy-D-manno-octulosonate 8-phosphate phosphatase KdsC-like HAD superfamily phosphatase
MKISIRLFLNGSNNGEETKIWSVEDVESGGQNEILRISPEITIACIMDRQSFQVEKCTKDMNIGYLVENCGTKCRL